MAQVYLGNTLINQTWLGNTLLNKLELQPWQFILYGGGDIITNQTDFEDRLDFNVSGVTLGSFEIQNNNVYANFNYSSWSGNPFTFVDNAFTGSNATALYSIAPFNPSFRMFNGVTSLQSIYLVDIFYKERSGLDFARSFGQQSFNGCTGLTSDKIIIDPYSFIGQSAFAFCTGLTSAPAVWQYGPFAFNGCTNLNFANWPNLGIQNDGQGPSPVAIGQSTGDNNVFQNVANGGTINVPSFYATVNAGNPDGDLVYLSGTKGWTINYI
jgi:hypothetical protein